MCIHVYGTHLVITTPGNSSVISLNPVPHHAPNKKLALRPKYRRNLKLENSLKDIK